MFGQIIIGILACIIFFFVGYCVGLKQACDAFLDSVNGCDLDPEDQNDIDVDVFDHPMEGRVPCQEDLGDDNDYNWDIDGDGYEI